MRIPFGSQSYQHASLPLSSQRMVNCYLEGAPPQAKTQAAVPASCGVETFATTHANKRGARYVRGKLYEVSGQTLWQISESGIATALGTIPGTGYVFIAGDETNVAVVEPASRTLWFWNGTVVAQNTDPDFPGAVWLDILDGYYIIIAPNSGQFYITANRNPGSIDALDFASAERYPDNLVTGIVDHGELILFGTDSAEGFYDSGATDFPLTKIGSADIEFGCPYPRGPAKADNAICFPASDGKVYRLNGYTPQVISNPVIEQAIEKAVDRDFIGRAWKEPGHSFYSLSCDDFAFVYDFSTNLWYERESYGYDSWRWSYVLNAFNGFVVGDSQSAAVGTVSARVFTEFGTTMRCACTSPAVGEDNKRMTHARVELVFEQGVGLVTGQGSDPQVMLQFSDDGGRTWSSEKWRSLGAIGEFKSRAIWNRLGMARDRIYRYSVSDPVRRTLILSTTEAKLRAA